MQMTLDSIEISSALSVRWEAVRTLKVLNDKLLFVMTDGVNVEIRGLPAWKIDQMFRAYSRHQHHRNGHTKE